MGNPLALRAAPAWLLILPDTDTAQTLATRARPYATQEHAHASGRPWLLGCWPPETLATGQYRSVRVAVLGEHAVTRQQADKAAAAATSPTALEHCASAWPGSHLLTASLDGAIWARGTVTGVRRLFHSRAGRIHVAADRADVLAELIGAPVDEERMAVQMLSLGILHPFSGLPVWRGVEALPGGHALTLDRDGQRLDTVRWWSPPAPDVPLHQAADRLRDALQEAVALRVRGRDLVSTDLGGLDSTAVCCTAVHSGANLVAYTAATHDVRGDDVHWAQLTARGLRGMEHRVVPADRIPLTFDGVDALTDVLDSPSLFAVDRNRRMSIIEQAVTRGSSLHLSGFGGDELLGGASARVHDLLVRSPRTALRHTRGYLHKYRWSRRGAVRQLLDRRPYPAWLERVAADLLKPLPPAEEPLFQWCTPPRMPPWATPEAVSAVRRLIRAHVQGAHPLGAGHGVHRELATMEAVSRFARHLNQITGSQDMVFAAPFYDDRVIEVCLAVRPEQRVTPWAYKPLIVEAMRGVVPDVGRSRATKANATLEEEVGLRRHRGALLRLCEDSRLGRLGLVNTAALRAYCSGPVSAELDNVLLHPTVGCEVWLRSREGPDDRPDRMRAPTGESVPATPAPPAPPPGRAC